MFSNVFHCRYSVEYIGYGFPSENVFILDFTYRSMVHLS